MIVKIEGRDAYLADDVYQKLTVALAAVEPCPSSDKIEPWQFVEVLGEIGGIWSADTLNDPLRDPIA